MAKVIRTKYSDINTMILSQEMPMCNRKTLIFIILLWKMLLIFFNKNISNVKIKRFSTNKEISISKGLSCEIWKFSVHKLIARLQFSRRPNSKVKDKGLKMLVITKRPSKIIVKSYRNHLPSLNDIKYVHYTRTFCRKFVTPFSTSVRTSVCLSVCLSVC